MSRTVVDTLGKPKNTRGVGKVAEKY